MVDAGAAAGGDAGIIDASFPSYVTMVPEAYGVFPQVCEKINVAFLRSFPTVSYVVELSFYEDMGNFYSDANCAMGISSKAGSPLVNTSIYLKSIVQRLHHQGEVGRR